jgi:NAD-dependent dihydropyrimidine dehydrogenase PreA subunit
MEAPVEMQIFEDRCTGCGICSDACPNDAIKMNKGLAVINQANCTQCQACMDACPSNAIGISELITVPSKHGELVSFQGGAIATREPSVPKLFINALVEFAGKEILPMVADSLVGALDRRLARTPPDHSQVLLPVQNTEPATMPRTWHGKGFRHRKGQGNQRLKRQGQCKKMGQVKDLI